MIVFITGSRNSRVTIDRVAGEAHDVEAVAFNERMATRRELDLPAYEIPNSPRARDVSDLELWEADPDLSSISGCPINLSAVDVAEFQRRYREQAFDDDDAGDVKAAKVRGMASLMREFVQAAWADVEGFETPDGEALPMGAAGGWAAEHLDLLEENGLLMMLWRAGHYVQSLRGEARGKCGASPQMSSPKETATDAPESSELLTGVYQTATPAPGLQAPPTPGADALGPSSERIRALPMPSDSTTNAGAS